ncbi:MAG: acyltransferase [Pseudomonas sp.]|nr:acyltransferase [Pseudomonas sp.]
MRLDVQGLKAVVVLAVLVYNKGNVWPQSEYVGVDLFLIPDVEFFRQGLKSAALGSANQYAADFGSCFAPQTDELLLLSVWSMAIDMQFSLFFSILARSCGLPGLSLLAAAWVMWASIKISSGEHGREYLSLIARMPAFLVWVGGVSYPLYLWHWPILAFFRYYLGQYELSRVWLLRALVASVVPGVHYVETSNSSSFTDAPGEKGELIHQDNHHLNEVGACRYGYFAGGQLRQLFEPTQSTVSLKQ